MYKMFIKVALLFSIMAMFLSCATSQEPVSVKEPLQNTLRVGITPSYPPLIFKLGDNLAGIEVDLAQQLGKELNRKVEFVEFRWDALIPALLEGKIDIIMSGMSITKAREVRVAFTDHYLKSGLLIAMRSEDSRKYSSLNAIKEDHLAAGVLKDTTGDVFVQNNLPRARRVPYSKSDRAAFDLKQRRINIFVDDALSVIWLVSENEADLTALWDPLTEEYIAWGVRRDNTELLNQVNSILSTWKQDGTLHNVLEKWLPSEILKHFE
jgi:polar amino acid transport system substrate-binding protein